MKLARINSQDYFECVFKDTNTRKAGIYLYEVKINRRTGEETIKENYISTLIYIEYKVRAENAIWYNVVYFDNDKRQNSFIKASELFSENHKENRAYTKLIDNGLIVSNKCHYALIEYLKCQSEVIPNYIGTEYNGWNEEGDYIGFGLSTNEDIYFVGSSQFKYKTAGSKEQYLAKLRIVFDENPLIFAICSYSISSFLLGIISNEINQVLSILGTSSKGKSAAGKLALSMTTSPDGYKGFNATAGAMDNILKNSHDCFIFFDEVAESNLTPEQRQRMIYSLANGSERSRLKRDSATNEYSSNITREKKLKYTVLIAGETSFLQGVKTEGTGIDARYLEIVLPPSIPLWDGIKTGLEAEELQDFLKNNYGHIALDFVNKVKQHKEDIPRIYKQKLEAIRNELDDKDPIVARKVRILAYSYISAMYLAQIVFGEDVANEYADISYLAFKKALLVDTPKDKNNVYKEVLAHLEHQTDRYMELYDKRGDNSIKENEPINTNTILDKFGFIKLFDTYKEISIISNRFTDFCLKLNLDEKLFIANLKEHNHLISDKDRNTKKIRVNGVNANYFVARIPYDFFDENEETETKDIFEETNTPWE